MGDGGARDGASEIELAAVILSPCI